MTDFDFKLEADRLVMVARLADDLRLEALIEAVNRAHTLGGILDPTKYRDALQSGAMDDIAALARLMQAVTAEYRRIRQRYGDPDRSADLGASS